MASDGAGMGRGSEAAGGQRASTGNNNDGVVWVEPGALPTITPVEGIYLGILSGENVMISLVTIEPGAAVPLHDHPNEQMGYVVEGIVTMTIGDDTRDLGPGAAYRAPGGVPHGATSDAGCIVLDVFSPPRADYAERARAAAGA